LGRGTLADARHGFAPVGAVTPFVQGGLGVHLVSHASIGDRRLGTSFHFGQQVIFGIRFGQGRRHSLAARAEHVSNGDLKDPNDGVSFYGLEYRYGW
jgi:lipid A 3-O-deacylase